MTTYNYTIDSTDYAIERRGNEWKLYAVTDNGYGVEDYEWIETFDLKRDAVAYMESIATTEEDTTMTTEQQLTAIEAKSYKEQTEAFGRALNRLAQEAAADCSDEILAILQEDDREARASYRSEKVVDDNGQSIDVVATALGYQDTHNVSDVPTEGTGVSSTQIIISNLALYVGKQAAWKSGFNADSYAKAQSKLRHAGIEAEVFDNYGRLKGLPKANGKPRKQRVARKVKPSAR